MNDNQNVQNQPQGQAKQQDLKQEQITQPLTPGSSSGKLNKFLPILLIVVIVAAGITTGLVLSSVSKNSNKAPTISEEEELSPQIKENLAQTFKDEAQGTIEKNDELDKYAQGTHKLIRPGGESQTAYITSSVLDLDEYTGKKVKVYGETFGSSQVGWLMDVGKVEVLE